MTLFGKQSTEKRKVEPEPKKVKNGERLNNVHVKEEVDVTEEPEQPEKKIKLEILKPELDIILKNA